MRVALLFIVLGEFPSKVLFCLLLFFKNLSIFYFNKIISRKPQLLLRLYCICRSRGLCSDIIFMVFFFISKYVTKWIGPTLFRNGLRLRNRLTRTQTTSGVELASMNNYWLDLACMIPYSQKLLSLAIYDESRRLALEFRKQYQHDQQKESKTDGKAVASSSPSRSDDAMATISMITDPAAIRRLSNMRIGVLDDYLRPSLIPNNLWTDVERNWRYNTRIVAWARKEFLISKYGPYIQEAMVAYPKLQDSPQISTSSSKGGSGGNKRRFLLDLVHRGEINTDNIGGGPVASVESPFLRLPTSDVIAKAFRMKGWTNVKSPERCAYKFCVDENLRL